MLVACCEIDKGLFLTNNLGVLELLVQVIRKRACRLKIKPSSKQVINLEKV